MELIRNSGGDDEKKSLVHEDALSKITYSSITTNRDPILQSVPSFDPANKVTLSWHNINVFVRPTKKRFWNFKNQYDISKQKQLLHNVNGQVRPGQLLAIIGASGAGKTTLLNVLTCRNLRKLVVKGKVLVNGENIGSNMPRISAYVQQDDLFIGTLTVREHLVFQALLRMDKQLTYEERMKRVSHVLAEMGLSKCANTKIGFPGRIKGISGGEMKRLAFAAEVLTNPALMFCDEPTSGLDSFMAQSIVTVLRDMAAGGRTIVCTIHQPSSEVYEMFDNLLLMAEGRVAYMGLANKALEFFERAGLRCPVNYNPADFFIHNLAVVPGKEAESRERITNICSQFERESRDLEKTSSTACSVIEGNQANSTKYKASWCKQFTVLLKRSWISVIREPMFTKVRFMQSLRRKISKGFVIGDRLCQGSSGVIQTLNYYTLAKFIAVLLGLIYLNQIVDQNGIMNINGALFLILLNVTFTNVFHVVNRFCLETPIFLREHWNGMYRTDVYFLTKTLAEAPILISVTVLYSTILYWMVGFNPQWQAFLICVAIIVLIANVAASFGYMISCMSSSLNVALSISTPLMIPLLLFGGFYLNNASVPIYFIWVKYISWFYYGNEALVINQWSSIKNITCPADQLCPVDGRAELKYLNFNEDNFLQDVGLLIVLLVVFRSLAFLFLYIRSSRRT